MEEATVQTCVLPTWWIVIIASVCVGIVLSGALLGEGQKSQALRKGTTTGVADFRRKRPRDADDHITIPSFSLDKCVPSFVRSDLWRRAKISSFTQEEQEQDKEQDKDVVNIR
jgi:hypothetical protein